MEGYAALRPVRRLQRFVRGNENKSTCGASLQRTYGNIRRLCAYKKICDDACRRWLAHYTRITARSVRSCKKDREFKCIRLANQACRQLGIEHPKVVLCGLNPHAGENGLFGDEKIKEISPRSERPAHFDKGRRLRV